MVNILFYGVILFAAATAVMGLAFIFRPTSSLKFIFQLSFSFTVALKVVFGILEGTDINITDIAVLGIALLLSCTLLKSCDPRRLFISMRTPFCREPAD